MPAADSAELWSAKGEGTALIFSHRLHTRRVFRCTATLITPSGPYSTELQLLPPYRSFMAEFFRSLALHRVPSERSTWVSEYDEVVVETAAQASNGDLVLSILLPDYDALDAVDPKIVLTADRRRLSNFADTVDSFLLLDTSTAMTPADENVSGT